MSSNPCNYTTITASREWRFSGCSAKALHRLLWREACEPKQGSVTGGPKAKPPRLGRPGTCCSSPTLGKDTQLHPDDLQGSPQLYEADQASILRHFPSASCTSHFYSNATDAPSAVSAPTPRPVRPPPPTGPLPVAKFATGDRASHGFNPGGHAPQTPQRTELVLSGVEGPQSSRGQSLQSPEGKTGDTTTRKP